MWVTGINCSFFTSVPVPMVVQQVNVLLRHVGETTLPNRTVATRWGWAFQWGMWTRGRHVFSVADLYRRWGLLSAFTSTIIHRHYAPVIRGEPSGQAKQAMLALFTLSLFVPFTLCLNILYFNYFKGIFHTFICVFMNLLTSRRWVWSRGKLTSPLQAEDTPACRP